MMNQKINITPRTFGNIAASAFANGCDVTSFVIRSAADKAAATHFLRRPKKIDVLPRPGLTLAFSLSFLSYIVFFSSCIKSEITFQTFQLSKSRHVCRLL